MLSPHSTRNDAGDPGLRVVFSSPYVFQAVRFPGLARDGVLEGGGAPSGGSAIAV